MEKQTKNISLQTKKQNCSGVFSAAANMRAARQLCRFNGFPEQSEILSLSSLAIDDEPVCTKKSNVLLDGGASHHVYYGPKVPDGALEREV